jgi:TRAP-type C4-dicarboxylate transport system permease small subunit
MLLNLIERLARLTAILGGFVLTALVILTCISVAGRTVGLGPVNGDFELVEAGVAFAIFAFLPLCQLHGGHATVDVFTSFLPVAASRALVAFWEVVLAAVIVLISWRLFGGMMGKIGNGETTFILQFPIWWSYAASFAAAVVASIVAVFCAVARVLEALTRRVWMPRGEGASH